MTKTRRTGWLLLALLLAGCNSQDTKALTRIGKNVQARAESVTGDVKTNAAANWSVLGEQGVETRVAARLRWDKTLADANIEVVSAENGIELRGQVRNGEQRRRAVMLAESTTGVENVKDALTEVE